MGPIRLPGPLGGPDDVMGTSRTVADEPPQSTPPCCIGDIVEDVVAAGAGGGEAGTAEGGGPGGYKATGVGQRLDEGVMVLARAYLVLASLVRIVLVGSRLHSGLRTEECTRHGGRGRHGRRG